MSSDIFELMTGMSPDGVGVFIKCHQCHQFFYIGLPSRETQGQKAPCVHLNRLR